MTTTTITKATDFITFSRGSLATVTDSDGKIKWAPHNFVLNSAAPVTQSIGTIVGAKYKVEITGSGSVALSGAGTGTVSLGVPVEITASTSSLALTVSGSVSTMWAYRSDLGGMQLNASGSTYNVTTGSIYYGPRLDYTLTGLARGLLLEEQRVNVVAFSNDLSNVLWQKTGINVTKTTGPDGVSESASLISATTNNATVKQSCAVSSSIRSQSAYVKRITGSGTVEMTMDNGSTWSSITATSEWSRVSIPSQTLSNPVVGFRISTSGDEIVVYGVQNENGSFVTSLIPTLDHESSEVTWDATTDTYTQTLIGGVRSSETSTVNTSQFPYSMEQGSIIVSVTPINVSANRRLLQIDDGTENERYTISTNSTPNGVYTVIDNGVSQASIAAGTPAANTTLKLSTRYKLNDFALSVNGSAVVVDTSGSLPTANSILRIGSSSSSTEIINGWVRGITYFPRALSNTDLQSRST